MKGSAHARELRSICELVESLGGKAYRIGQRAMPNKKGRWYIPQTSGIADLEVLMDWRRARLPAGYASRNYAFKVEVKVGKDRVSAAQRDYIERATDCGIVVVVGNLSSVIPYLRTLGYEVRG